jgi:glycosyltransferase involved in cell wall biosynthesis
MTAAPVLTFIIPVRNDEARLAQCLASIARNGHTGVCEILVIDNGSADGSVAVARRAGATVIELPHTPVAEMRNTGAGAAKGTLLAFVDADHILDAGWVAAALETLEDENVTAAGAPYATPGDANWLQRAYGRLRPELKGSMQVDWLGSGNLIVRAEAFHRVGGFDTSLETCEDVDLCNRLRLHGFRLIADERLRSVHLGDPATVRAVFFGELWRGRDNMRVTLRGLLSLRALPSLLIPVWNLAALAAVALGLVLWPWAGGVLVAAAVLALVLTVALRLWRLLPRRAWVAGDLLGAMAVAATYEVARALALVARATHRTRREVAKA